MLVKTAQHRQFLQGRLSQTTVLHLPLSNGLDNAQERNKEAQMDFEDLRILVIHLEWEDRRRQ